VLEAGKPLGTVAVVAQTKPAGRARGGGTCVREAVLAPNLGRVVVVAMRRTCRWGGGLGKVGSRGPKSLAAELQTNVPVIQ